MAFVDGQNLFHEIKQLFDYAIPNFDVDALARRICVARGWTLMQVRFYTGVPNFKRNPRWHQFWERKLSRMSRQGVYVFTRELRYSPHERLMHDGSSVTQEVGREKGVDVRLALDLVALAIEGFYDVALVFSQDQDYSEAAEEIRRIAGNSGRWLKIASAYPVNAAIKTSRGINKTDWIPFDRTLYDACLDPDAGHS